MTLPENIMSLPQQMITVGLCILATMTTRFLPFLIFREKKETPAFIQYIGKYLPSAVFGMLIVYCLKDVELLQGSHGIPETIAIALTAGVHLWKRNMLVSIAIGTISYMLLIQLL